LADFFEPDAHTHIEFAVDDQANGVQLFVLMSDVDFEPGAGRERVQHVEIATLAADVACACREASFGASLDHLG